MNSLARSWSSFRFRRDLPLEFGRELDALAQQLNAVEPSAVVPTACRPGSGWTPHESSTSTSGVG